MNIVVKCFAVLCLAGLSACRTIPPPTPPAVVDHVVVIGIDGMSPDGIRNAPTPVLDRMMAEGAYTLRARAVLPTSSSSNWASMLMGAGPEQHGITSNDWERDQHALPAVAVGSEAIFPTIFGILRAQRPDATIAAVYHWDGFGRLFEKSAVDVDIVGTDEAVTTDEAVRVIRAQRPTLLFVHLDHVDHAGHTYAHGSPAYYASVARADSLVGRIVAATREAGIHERTLFLVTSDHGGVGKGHGGESVAEIEIPFLLSGAGVRRGYAIRQPVLTYDNAATVAWALGVEPPYAWTGRPVRAAFEGHGEPTLGASTPPPPGPTIEPAAQSYDPAGGLFVDRQPTVRMQANGEGDVRYTLDGSVPTVDAPRYTTPFELDRTTVVRARTFRADGSASRTSDAYFRLASGAPGLRWAYYENDGDAWEQLPDFTTLRPARTGTAYEFRLAPVAPREAAFAVRFEGHLQVDRPGTYTFCTFSDDGSRLYIDGRVVADNDGSHGAVERCGDVTLEAGDVPVAVTYFQGGGGQWLDVFYHGPGVPRQIVPADRLHGRPRR